MNDFSQIDGQSEFRNEMTMEPQELYTGEQDQGPDSMLEMEYEDRVSGCDGEQEPDQGWPGDGSGTDDFQDMNQNEFLDYQDE